MVWRSVCSAIACAAALLFAPSVMAGNAAPRPAAFGPEAPYAKPRGGFVGAMTLSPDRGPVGARVAVRAEGLPPDQTFQLVWRTVKGRWKVDRASYKGRAFTPVGYRIAELRSDASGKLTASFNAPEDFGFGHDVVLQQGERLFTQANFNIAMTLDISPKSGPVGTMITVDVKGIGWKYLQNSWMLMYDNKLTGWISSVTTGGSARFTIPATGHVGTQVLEVQHGAFTFPYRNMQQSPQPDRPTFKTTFRITPGAPVLPPPLSQQLQKSVRRIEPNNGRLKISRRFSTVQTPLVVRAEGLQPGKTYKLNWSTVTGNRVSGSGWETSQAPVASAIANAEGKIAFHFKTPDDLGGEHELSLRDGEKRLTTSHWIAPSANPLNVARGPAGTKFRMHLKGVGWSETANIYTIVYDNAYIGYSCGFNSQGDVEIFLHASGAPGWHFIDLYPAIYKGKERVPRNFRLPQLTYADDHPGEDLPRFRYAFEIVETEQRTSGQRAQAPARQSVLK